MDIVLIYPNAEGVLKQYVFGNLSNQTVEVGTWICLHPYVLGKSIKLALNIKLDPTINIKQLFTRLVKEIYEKHLQAYVETIKPKFVITFIDDSGVFHRLSKNYTKDSTFIAIQNGMRPGCHFNRLSKLKDTESFDYIPNFFCHGYSDEISFKNEGWRVDNYYPIGSLIGGIYWKEITKNTKPLYDICYVSSWTEDNRTNISENDFEVYKADIKANKILDQNLKELIKDKGYSVIIALKYEDSKEELEHFYKTFGNNVHYQKRRENFSTYKAIDKSRLTLSTYSTCTAEAIGIGKKGLFYNGFSYPGFKIPSAGICYYEGDNFTKFSNKVESILELTDDEFKDSMSKDIKNIMNYDLSEMPHEKLYKFLHKGEMR